jgi:hypothetical protein
VGTSSKRRVRGVIILLVLAGTLAMFVLAFLGITERESYAYASRYGTPVELIAGDNCVVVSSNRRADVWKDCAATWTVDGTEVEGRLLAGVDDPLDGDAFAVGRKVFTKGYRPEGNPQLGLMPVWLFIPFPLTVIVLLKMYGKRIKRWASDGN